MKTICVRLHRGDDLLGSIRKIADTYHIEAGVPLSAVGCVSQGRLRDASGITLRDINEPCEIVSLNGTVSHRRCHLHLALSKEDLSTVGGHLVEGCIINTTCELVIGLLEDWQLDTEFDPQTGYDEVIFERTEV